MPTTYERIFTSTLGSTAASFTFSSIPSTFSDLVLIGNFKASVAVRMQFNGDTTTTYSYLRMGGNGTSAYSDRGTSTSDMYVGLSSNTNFDVNIFNILQYANTTTNKTVLARTSVTGNSAQQTVGLWRSNAAITSILLSPSSASFAAGSIFTLYGIKAA